MLMTDRGLLHRCSAGLAIAIAAMAIAGCNPEPAFNAAGRCVKNCKGLKYVGTGTTAGGAFCVGTENLCYVEK